jgi:regulator of RNase E activity RraA
MMTMDRSAIRQRTPDFHVFSTGWVVSHGYGTYLDFDVTVSICGLTISPSDLLHGDESGLVSVPIDIAADVVMRAEAVGEEEAEYFDFLESNRFSMEELKRRIIPHE